MDTKRAIHREGASVPGPPSYDGTLLGSNIITVVVRGYHYIDLRDLQSRIHIRQDPVASIKAKTSNFSASQEAVTDTPPNHLQMG
jgi:hypothetical protein